MNLRRTDCQGKKLFVECAQLAAAALLAVPLSAAAQFDSDRVSAWPQQETAYEETGFLRVQEFLAKHGDFTSRAKRFTPAVELSTYLLPDAELDDAPGDFDLFRYDLDALVPLPISEDSFLLFGGHASARRYVLSTETGFDDESLYGLGVRLGGGRFINDDLALQGYWQPSIYSDFGGAPYSDDWKLWYGSGLAVYRQGDNLFWKAGFSLTQALNTGVIPLLGVSWLPASDWRIDILAPRLFEASYMPHPEWDLHAGVRVDAEKFSLRQSLPEGEMRRNVRVQEISLYAGAWRKLNKHAAVFLRSGFAMSGEYDWHDRFEGDVEPAPFMQAGMGVSF